jgi:hypothetical protein
MENNKMQESLKEAIKIKEDVDKYNLLDLNFLINLMKDDFI